jgi:hypothetical protein
VISSTGYESPQFGYAVEWDDNWRVWEELDGGGATTDPGAGEDTLTLYRIPSDDGDGHASIQIGARASDGSTTEELVEFWSSGEFLEENYSEDVELIDAGSSATEGAVVVQDQLDGVPIYVYLGALTTIHRETTMGRYRMFRACCADGTVVQPSAS